MSLKNIMAAVAISLLTLSCSSEQNQQTNQYTGYIEAVTLYISSPSAGWIEQLEVTEGSQVTAGQVLVKLDEEFQQLAVAQAQANVEQAKEQLMNSQSGARDEEIEVVKWQLQEQQALLEEAKHELKRQKQMLADKSTSEANVDKAQASFDALSAKGQQLQQQLKVLSLPAREHLIQAAKAQVDAAEQGVKLQQWQLEQRTLVARQGAVVDEIYFRQGEFVPQGVPILSMLVSGQTKVRFYISQGQVSRLQLGQVIQVKNDGEQQAKARISFIAKQPEFTPPVLYSNDNREQLVFLVEAILDRDQFRPGQPVNVQL